MKTSVAIVTVLVALTASGCAQSDSAPDLSTPEARGSYAQGVALGEGGQGLPLDQDAFVAGVRAGLNGTSQMDPQQRQQAIMEFRTILQAAATEQGAEVLAEGQAFLAENGQREGVTTTASGLQYEVLRAGDGPTPTAEDTVVIHYRGSTMDGNVFDESYDDGEPTPMAIGQVIAGFQEALQLMPVGAHYKFFLPGALGYGMTPPPGGEIRPNDVLIFEIELIRIEG